MGTNEIYSLVDICLKVNKTIREKIYCVTCGENRQNAVFSCTDHMPMVIFAVKTSQSTKKYLQEMYYLFAHVNFQLKHKKS